MIRLFSLFCLLFALGAPASRGETAVTAHVSPDGHHFWLVEEPSIPILSIALLFRGGTALDPSGKEGVTLLMASLLEEGADDLDANGFATATEDLAARFYFDAWRDNVSVSATMLAEEAGATVALLNKALAMPRFAPDAIARVKEQIQSTLDTDATDPDEIANRLFREASFPGHPYGQPYNGTPDSIARLTAADIIAAHQMNLTAQNALIGVAGALPAEEVGPLLDTLLSELPQGTSPQLADTVPRHWPDAPIHHVFKTPQTVIRFGHVGLPRAHPDFLIAYVVNEIFAGRGLTARLSTEIREKRGLTYGVSANLVGLDHAAQLTGSFSTRTAKVDEALRVLRDEWAKIAREGVTQAELDAAKRYLTGSYPLRFDSNVKIARNLVGLQSVGLPLSYIAERNDLVKAISLDDANRVAKTLYQPEQLSVVTVGIQQP